MMAALFVVLTLSMMAAFYHYRNTAIALVLTSLLLATLIFWGHATDELKINW